MKKLLTALIFILSLTSLLGQSLITQVTLQPAGKPLDVFSVYGIKTAIKGGASSLKGDLIKKIEFADIGNDGFVIRQDYKFIKYNENFEKEWENLIEPVYGLQALPVGKIVGNSNEVYFVQQKKGAYKLEELHITKFDDKGAITQLIYDTEKKHDKLIHAYVTDKGLHLLTYYIDKKANKILYNLITFSKTNLSSSTTPIQLDYDDYEVKSGNTYKFLAEKQDRIILCKSYLKNLPDSKLKEPVIKTVEVYLNGETINLKKFDFIGVEKFRYAPFTLELDDKRNTLMVFGYVSMQKSNMYVDGIYFNKFSYSDRKLILDKHISFDEIIDKSNSEEVRKQLIASIYQIAPTEEFLADNYFYDRKSGVLRLYIINKARGLMQNKVALNVVFINKEGRFCNLEEDHYLNNFLLYPNYILTPNEVKEVWNDGAEKNSSLDFINSFSSRGDTNLLLWTIIKKEDYDILISTKESTGEIKAFKIK